MTAPGTTKEVLEAAVGVVSTSATSHIADMIRRLWDGCVARVENQLGRCCQLTYGESFTRYGQSPTDQTEPTSNIDSEWPIKEETK